VAHPLELTVEHSIGAAVSTWIHFGTVLVKPWWRRIPCGGARNSDFDAIGMVGKLGQH
jgi:hypothetical protein